MSVDGIRLAGRRDDVGGLAPNFLPVSSESEPWAILLLVPGESPSKWARIPLFLFSFRVEEDKALLTGRTCWEELGAVLDGPASYKSSVSRTLLRSFAIIDTLSDGANEWSESTPSQSPLSEPLLVDID